MLVPVVLTNKEKSHCSLHCLQCQILNFIKSLFTQGTEVLEGPKPVITAYAPKVRKRGLERHDFTKKYRTDPSPRIAEASTTGVALAPGRWAARKFTKVVVEAGDRPGLDTVAEKRYGLPGADGARMPAGTAIIAPGESTRGWPSTVEQGEEERLPMRLLTVHDHAKVRAWIMSKPDEIVAL